MGVIRGTERLRNGMWRGKRGNGRIWGFDKEEKSVSL